MTLAACRAQLLSARPGHRELMPMRDALLHSPEKRLLDFRAGTARRCHHSTTTTPVAALASATTGAGIWWRFQQQAFADLLVAHCPRAEAMISADTAMLVRCAGDPGSSRAHHDPLSVMTGTAFQSENSGPRGALSNPMAS